MTELSNVSCQRRLILAWTLHEDFMTFFFTFESICSPIIAALSPDGDFSDTLHVEQAERLIDARGLVGAKPRGGA